MKITIFVGLLTAVMLTSITVITLVSNSSFFFSAYGQLEQQDYLQIVSASVNNQTGGELMNIEINTADNIPIADGRKDESENRFGYGVLSTGPRNVIVAVTDLGLEENKDKDKNENVVSANGLELHILEMTRAISQQCIDKGNYEVKVVDSKQNPKFNPDYSLEVKGKKLTIEDVKSEDLNSDIDAVVSFTATPIFETRGVGNEGNEPTQICINIVDRASIAQEM
jgi:hypothetical protein